MPRYEFHGFKTPTSYLKLEFPLASRSQLVITIHTTELKCHSMRTDSFAAPSDTLYKTDRINNLLLQCNILKYFNVNFSRDVIFNFVKIFVLVHYLCIFKLALDLNKNVYFDITVIQMYFDILYTQ